MNPKKMSNDTMALSIRLWADLDPNLTAGQREFFDEVIWRLTLMSDKEISNGRE